MSLDGCPLPLIFTEIWPTAQDTNHSKIWRAGFNALSSPNNHPHSSDAHACDHNPKYHPDHEDPHLFSGLEAFSHSKPHSHPAPYL